MPAPGTAKKSPGSRVSAWDPVVAELPDLSDMISKSYVNEVDISRVQTGQLVEISVDAFPDSKYPGTVIEVANIGEQLRGYDAKVFEVVVQLHEVDSILRPAMTTANSILTNTYEEVLFIPLEALHNDSLNFVYKKEGKSIIRQEVVIGPTNDNEVIIFHGLDAGQEVFMNVPEGGEKLELMAIETAVKEQVLKAQQELERARKAEAKKAKPDAEQEGGAELGALTPREK